jgi:hypothetical protein
MFSVDTVVVSTLAEFKALNIRPNQVVAKGKDSVGDGWDGQFYWKAGDTTTADDETVIQCTRGEAGRYFRLNQRQPHLAVNGALAGNATFSVNGYAYIGSPLAQDPAYLGGINVNAITKANPGVVTTTLAHGLTTGQQVTFTMPSGMTELHGVTATATVLSPTTYSIGINTTSYSTYTDYATNHGRAAPAGTELAEVSGLTIRTDNVGGGGIVIRNRLYTGLMYQNFANDAGDIEGGFQQNGTGNSSLAGSRAFNIYSNYGDLGIYTQIQGTPNNVVRIIGSNTPASEGFVGIGTTLPTSKLMIKGADSSTTVGISVYRADLAYGYALSEVSSGGNTSLYAIGSGSTLILGGASTTGLTLSSTAVNASLPVYTIAGTTGAAGFRVPHGVAPTAPTNGDIWTTTAGMFVRINGVTKSVNLT